MHQIDALAERRLAPAREEVQVEPEQDDEDDDEPAQLDGSAIAHA